MGFVAMFAALTFAKVFHWLAQDRIDYIEVTPSVSRLAHARIVAFLAALLVRGRAAISFSCVVLAARCCVLCAICCAPTKPKQPNNQQKTTTTIQNTPNQQQQTTTNEQPQGRRRALPAAHRRRDARERRPQRAAALRVRVRHLSERRRRGGRQVRDEHGGRGDGGALGRQGERRGDLEEKIWMMLLLLLPGGLCGGEEERRIVLSRASNTHSQHATTPHDNTFTQHHQKHAKMVPKQQPRAPGSSTPSS